MKAAASQCSGVPAPFGDKLAGLFTYYNWSMLFRKDFALLDSNEPTHPNKELFQGSFAVVNQPNFTNTLDLKD